MRIDLRERRMDMGVSQHELANKLSIRRETIGRIENEGGLPNLLTALKLAKFLGCKVEDIFVLERSDVLP